MFKGNRFMTHRARALYCAAVVAASTFFLPTLSHAQAVPGTGVLALGQLAPDFTIKSVNANGLTAKPFHLADHRGETVVLAFFPRARSQGCTVQMESYRDNYSTLMHNGNKVTLIGISIDSDTTLQSWARDAKFQFNFGSDVDRAVGAMFGASNAAGGHRRVLYVINPDGKIGYIASPFKQLAAEAYTELGAAIDKAASMH
ncbi:MAG: redoxin domain-containing protein [Gemmatimonadaceae bacterium]